MFEDLIAAVEDDFSTLRFELESLVRIASVSAPGYPGHLVRDSALATAELLRTTGMEGVRLLEVEGAHPAVFGEIPGPPGAPTVLLYAHHDVQPPGPDEQWEGHPFEPIEQSGRLYGRGTSDDKAGIVMHVGALRAHGGHPPVGVKVFVEGEEEIGSAHLPQFLEAHSDLLQADVIVIADSGNWKTGQPALTISLRGLVDCTVTVRTLDVGVHSGQFGGVVPDALSVLVRTLSSLHDDAGEVAIPGLVSGPADPLDLTEEELRDQAGVRAGVELIGSGGLTERLWTKPACSILAIDAPRVSEAINQLVPEATAKISLRLAPGQDVADAMAALINHLEENVPWGAEVVVTPGSSGDAFSLQTTGPHFDAWRTAFDTAWGTPTVNIGVGGSIPFVAAFSEIYPKATILLTGVADPSSRAHGPNESLDLAELKKGTIAEAIALRLLGEGAKP